MDEITQRVREMYEQYPYPQGAPMIRAATDARLVLSYLAASRVCSGPLNVLDAGCGRGVGVLPCAALQPDVNFVGIDINRVALAEATANAMSRGITNLQFQEVDLMTLDGLEVPEGGFDVIYSSGVLHHLSDPAEGLKKLKEVLAPHGVLIMMVYAEHGRAPLYRLRNAVEILLPPDTPLSERIGPSRQLAQFMASQTLTGSPWANTPKVVDVEFVDQVLNVNETSYSVDAMWSLMSDSGMQFVRWLEPDDWCTEKLLPPGALREHASTMSAMERYRFIEQTSWRTTLQFVMTHEGNQARPELRPDEVESTVFCVSPEVTFQTVVRNLYGNQRVEELGYTLRNREPVIAESGPFALMLMLLRDQNLPFTGDMLVRIMGEEGVSREVALAQLEQCVVREILYRPHRSEIAI